jgi:tetratricopeptide (TPR) repeat protein
MTDELESCSPSTVFISPFSPRPHKQNSSMAKVGGVPCLIREVLYAPPAPDSVALLMEVASTHHNSGQFEAAVNTYTQSLQEWERVLRDQTYPELVQAENITFMQKVKREQLRAPRMIKITPSKDLKQQQQQQQGESTGDGKETEEELIEDLETLRERARQDAEEAEQRQKRVEAVHRAYDLVPIEGKLYLSLAIGSVYESAANDERALAEYLVAYRLLQTIPVFQTNLLAATVYSCLGSAYFHLSQYDFAADYFFRALEIREQLLPTKHVDIAAMLNNIGVVLHLLDRPSDALTLMYRAQESLESQLAASHPRLELVNNNIRRTKQLFFKEKSNLAPVPFVPLAVPMIPGALKARKFFQPKPKKKAEPKKK